MSTPVTLSGRLTRDPELKFSASGVAVAKFSVVTSRRQLNKQTNEWEDQDVSFWDCVCFKQLAENVADSLVKGTAVIVQGRAAQRTWEAKDGSKRISVEVSVDEVGPTLRFATAKVSKASRGDGGGGQSQRPQGSTAAGASANDPWQSNDQPPF